MKSRLFDAVSRRAAHVAGLPQTYAVMAGLILIWGLLGPLFHFSDTWQLVVNTSTSIITFLMVFLIQSSQNRDTAALQIKLDELLRVQKDAHNALLDLEELDEEALANVRRHYCELAREARRSPVVLEPHQNQ